MDKTTIMLVCSAGLSTNLLMAKMQTAAIHQNIAADIFAVPASEADEKLEEKPVDVLLLGPQVRFLKAEYEKRLTPKGILLDVINMGDYGLMNGEKVLAHALSLLDK